MHAVTVDDYLPWDPYSKKLLFCSSKDEVEFWPCLLEKAYAKFWGSYADLVGGYERDALKHLTGNEWEDISDFRHMYHDVCDHIASDGLVMASTPDSDGLKSKGLTRGHAYSVTGFGGSVLFGKCVRVRNPWGNYMEWKGEVANVLNKEEDGEFVMKWDDFCDNFDWIAIQKKLP